MPKLHLANEGSGFYLFWCPGCEQAHGYYTKPHKRDGFPQPTWSFNGDLEKPTFTPSLLLNHSRPELRCHLFMTDGVIHYCRDSHHKLAGKTVDCPEWQEGDIGRGFK